MTGLRKAQPRPGVGSGRGRPILVRPRRVGPGEQMRTLSIGGRVLRVAVRDGNPASPPLLLCNGIGARLELLQPFVDALDRQWAIIRFDMPGIGGSRPPLLPYHLATLPPLLSGLLDQLGYQQADTGAAHDRARRLRRRRRQRTGGLRARTLRRPADHGAQPPHYEGPAPSLS
jgi:pimeloyl-ACP methyl ester carboxylesterase